MTPVQKALWFIESHFAQALDLDTIAASAGVSRFYLTRAFGEATGRTVMLYVRDRRLSVAAQALAAGAPDILAVALQAGYSSHQAFTRAFRDVFGATPEGVREQRSIANLQLVEPILMTTNLLDKLDEPRIETSRPMLIGGLSRRYTCESSAAIPSQWQEFLPHLGSISGQVGDVAYGLKHNAVCDAAASGDDAVMFNYLCGVEVSDASDLPQGFTSVRVPRHSYAVFTHREHVSGIRSTFNTIWNAWLPQSRFDVADAPEFERYDARFDARTGLGGFEIWVPVKPRM